MDEAASRIWWWWIGTLGVIAALTAFAIACFAAGDDSARIVGMLMLIFLSSGLVGVLLGFLFAVPRSSEDDGAVKNGRLLWTNTNLSKVSDWLTTMLIGVGLTQLHAVDTYLSRFRVFLSDAVVAVGITDPGARWIPYAGPLMLVFAACCGFILMYMHTRLNLVPLLHKTEEYLQGAAKSAVQGVARTVAGAAANVAKFNNVSVGDALSVMLNALYEPDGYLQVISLARDLEGTAVAEEGEYWFLRACAYGQLYNALIDDPEREAEAADAKKNALDAAQRAVRRDPKYRDRLWSISDPNGPDGDLEAFRDDPEFKSIVGR